MKSLLAMVRRNTKIFFFDKGTFFTAMISPIVLVVLFITFLGDVYRDSLAAVLPAGMTISKTITEGFVGGWLFSSLLAVCCVTIAFCSNMIMVEDRAKGTRNDLVISPVSTSALAISYYIATLICTLIVCFTVLGLGFVYLAVVGWYLSVLDVLLLCLDVVLLVLFGTAFSSVVVFFLSTQGQIAAVGSTVSSSYGFLCGAYMPLSQFSSGLQAIISCLPGTYGTILLRCHFMRGALSAMVDEGLSPEMVDGMRVAFDNRIEFFGHPVSEGAMYAVLIGAMAALMTLYMLQNRILRRSAK